VCRGGPHWTRKPLNMHTNSRSELRPLPMDACRRCCEGLGHSFAWDRIPYLAPRVTKFLLFRLL
jgi:hypothetical protein